MVQDTSTGTTRWVFTQLADGSYNIQVLSSARPGCNNYLGTSDCSGSSVRCESPIAQQTGNISSALQIVFVHDGKASPCWIAMHMSSHAPQSTLSQA